VTVLPRLARSHQAPKSWLVGLPDAWVVSDTLQISVPRGRSCFVTCGPSSINSPSSPDDVHCRPCSMTLVTVPSGRRSSSWSPGFSGSSGSGCKSAFGTAGKGNIRPVCSHKSATTTSRLWVEFMAKNPLLQIDFFDSMRKGLPSSPPKKSTAARVHVAIRESIAYWSLLLLGIPPVV